MDILMILAVAVVVIPVVMLVWSLIPDSKKPEGKKPEEKPMSWLSKLGGIFVMIVAISFSKAACRRDEGKGEHELHVKTARDFISANPQRPGESNTQYLERFKKAQNVLNP